MIQQSRWKIIENFIAEAATEELIWLNGYLSGLLADKNVSEKKMPVETKPAVNKITIAYGTETGNAKKLASVFSARAKKAGINAKLVDLDQYRLNDLSKEEHFFTIVSTHGDGEPPAAAKKFFDHIHANGFKLEKLNYSVLALGDSSYPLFCRAGEEIDSQLSKLGGSRIVPLQKCDTDYEQDAEQWFEEVLKKLGNSAIKPASVVAIAPKKTAGKKIHEGTILSSVNLNDKGSNKQTYHIEIAAEGVDYLPGDAIGIVPENPVPTVEAILTLLQLSPDKEFAFRGEKFRAHDLLKKKLDIVYLPERVINDYSLLVNQEIPSRMGLLDLLRIYPLKTLGQFEQLIQILEPITPRLYSISSSPLAHEGEVHITVAKDEFIINEEKKFGLCSHYLSQMDAGASIQFYVHKNSQFRLPEEDKDIIMIGPGTGIAPFRSFLAHRDAAGAGGKNWLFFGEQRFVTDFLYQSEMQNWFETGVLSKISLAFSRDQQEKIYVQHKMKANGKELYGWLQNGSSLYVCGTKDPMSSDVEKTLQEIIQTHGDKSAAEATEYIIQLKAEGRYLKDVY